MVKNIFITGASGSGKTTVINYILKKYPKTYLNISCTTRNPRSNEINGKEYYFLTKEEFENKIKNNYFLEYVQFKGNYYGTPKNNTEENKDKSKIYRIFDVELNGIKFFYNYFKNSDTVNKSVFICLQASKKTIQQRLISRLEITDTEFQKRMESIEDMNNFINEFHFDFIINSEQSMDSMFKDVENIFSQLLNK